MAKQTTTAVSKSKSKVPVKKKKSGAAAAATASNNSSRSKAATAAAIKVKSKNRKSGAVTQGKTANNKNVAGLKKKTGGSSNGSKSKSTTTTIANKQASASASSSKSTISVRTTSNSTSSRSGNSNGNGSNPNSTSSSSNGGRRDGSTKSSEEKLPNKAPVDRSTVNFPYDVRINGVSSMISTINKSTPKVKKLLQDECDIILECRFCKNLFRSMPNFLCHKQIYCKNMVDSSPDASSVQHLLHRSVPRAFEYNIDLAAISINDNHQSSSSILQSSSSHLIFGQTETTSLLVEEENNKTRSPSTFLSQIDQSSSSDTKPKCAEEECGGVAKQKVCLVVEPVQNRKDGVVFQRRVDYPTEANSIDIAACDSSASISDIREVVDRDTAILGPDGKVMCTGTSRGIEKIVKHLTAQIEITQNKTMRNNSTNGYPGVCDICKTVFTTDKAYRQHKRDAPDCGGQISYAPNRSLSKTDEHSYLVNGNEDELREDQSRKAFVKKLFAPQSPFKSSAEVTEILQSPLKSPLFAKKLLQSSSPRTSPYKKVLSKAVKQIRQPEAASPSRHNMSPECSPLKSVSSFKPLPFFCIRCSRGFKTTNEMSVHIAECSGRSSFNESKIVAQGNAGRKKIGIQIRRSYFQNSSPVPSNEHDYACSSKVKVNLCVTAPESSPAENSNDLKIGNEAASEASTRDLCPLKTTDLAENREVNDTTNTGEKMEYLPALSDDKGKENDSSQRTNNAEKNENNNGSSSSESEGDRESISNKTDSGISFTSTTAASDQEESRSTDLEILESSISGTSKNGKAISLNEPYLQAPSVTPSFKRKRINSVDKVLRSNSAVVSLKRKSHRIRSKSKTVNKNEGSEVEVTKKK